jgi:hypothetical protein
VHIRDIRCSPSGSLHLGIDSFAGESSIEVYKIKARDMALEKELALGQLYFDALKMAAGGEGVSVTVLLGTDDASGCTSSTSGMLRVALERV